MSGKAVIVLGMSRTGTSAAARLLNLVGVDLGRPEQLLGPLADQNPKGFFENRLIVLLNEELLRRLGGSWSHPPALVPGWQTNSRLDDLRERARLLLTENFSAASLWGFKDPRLSVTLPFWRPLIDELSVVVCHRNVLEVGRSLERRDSLPLRDAIGQWVRYSASAIANTCGLRRTFVGYEELLAEPERVLEDLAAFVGQPELGADQAVLAEARDWITPDLRHHLSALSDVLTSPEVPPAARTLQLALDLAVDARRREPALHGAATSGPISDALDAAAAALAEQESRRTLGVARGRRLRVARGHTFGVAGGRPSPAARQAQPSGPRRQVDFVLLGSPEAVWRLADRLGSDPRLGLEADAGPGQLQGLAEARFSTGAPGQPIASLAAELASYSPHARLVMVIEDPLARAAEHHRDIARRGLERRSLERALREQLYPAALAGARAAPSATNGYITFGEYGRVASDYLEVFARDALAVVPTNEPDTLERVAGALGLYSLRSTAGPASVLGGLDASQQAERLPAVLLDALHAHFGADAELLLELTGVHVPWATGAPEPAPAALDASSPIGEETPDSIARQISAALAAGHGLAVRPAPEVSYGLLGFDHRSGRVRARSPLLELLRHRPIAIAGPLAGAAFNAQDEIGLDIPIALERLDPLAEALIGLGAARGEYDAVIISSPGTSSASHLQPELCRRLAAELGVVAIDVGPALERLLQPLA